VHPGDVIIEQMAKKPASKPKSSAKAAPKPAAKAPSRRPAKSIAPPPPSQIDRLARFLARFQRFARDIAGISLVALALMTLLGLIAPSWSGGLLAWWAGLLKIWFGWGSLWGVAVLGIWWLGVLRRNQDSSLHKGVWGCVFWLEGAAFASMAFLSALGDVSLLRADSGMDGGRVGWGLAEILRRVLEPIGLNHRLPMALIWGALLVFFLVLGLGVLQLLFTWLQRAAQEAGQATEAPLGLGPVISEAPLQGSQPGVAAEAHKKRTLLPAQFRKSFRIPLNEPETPPVPLQRSEHLPPLELLINEPFNRPDERNINTTAGMIEKTLADFGIPAKVVGFRVGPTVTQFAVEPGYLEKEKAGEKNGEKSDEETEINRQKVRVAQISSLGRDLALALAAERLRIEAPVPGRPYVGIEVPNARSSIVRLRPILESEIFYKIGSPLAIALGRDVSGAPVVADLSRMPHLLIAGTTGSGKSVCIAALTTCLVMNNSPEELRLVMIDPKMVELVRFNGLPHLYGKVETDLERILAVLRWVVAEMDQRYKVLEASRSRNIDTYNRKARRHKGEKPMPRIVVMIDELADLMMSAPDQTEHNLVRLAQMARAVGIHLVLATQRPSTDVVTGLIKANFPARISFAVASSIDSRVILDSAGAESLLGHGDMLYVPPEASSPLRVQGVMVIDQEVEKVITFWQRITQSPAQPEPPPWEQMMAQEEVLADRDGLVEKAIALVRQEQRASASMLQRRLRVGYPRAARLMDELEDMGVIGPSVSGGREREVLLEPDQDEDGNDGD
jgi:S-DNA-T family DNA segregation ATPase FtsK/SpoIIIE